MVFGRALHWDKTCLRMFGLGRGAGKGHGGHGVSLDLRWNLKNQTTSSSSGVGGGGSAMNGFRFLTLSFVFFQLFTR